MNTPRSPSRQEPYVIAAAVDGLQYAGRFSTDAWADLLSDLDLRPKDVARDGETVPMGKAFAAFEAAAAKAGMPDLALIYAKMFAVGATGPLGFALVHARTVRDAMKTMCQFVPITVSVRFCRYEEADETGSIVWQYPDVDGARWQYVAWAVAAGQLRIAEAMSPDWRPASIVLDLSPPADLAPYIEFFGRGLRFENGPNRFSVPAEFLDNPMPKADPRLYDLVTRLAGLELTQRGVGNSDFERRARDALPELLHRGEANAASLASELGMTPVELRTELKRQGLEVRSLVDEIRREMALSYLTKSDLTMTNIAFTLAYADSSAFTRACTKWFGKPPSEVRAEARSKA